MAGNDRPPPEAWKTRADRRAATQSRTIRSSPLASAAGEQRTVKNAASRPSYSRVSHPQAFPWPAPGTIQSSLGSRAARNNSSAIDGEPRRRPSRDDEQRAGESLATSRPERPAPRFPAPAMRAARATASAVPSGDTRGGSARPGRWEALKDHRLHPRVERGHLRHDPCPQGSAERPDAAGCLPVRQPFDSRPQGLPLRLAIGGHASALAVPRPVEEKNAESVARQGGGLRDHLCAIRARAMSKEDCGPGLGGQEPPWTDAPAAPRNTTSSCAVPQLHSPGSRHAVPAGREGDSPQSIGTDGHARGQDKRHQKQGECRTQGYGRAQLGDLGAGRCRSTVGGRSAAVHPACEPSSASLEPVEGPALPGQPNSHCQLYTKTGEWPRSVSRR